MPFGYLRDPLFIVSLVLYVANRWGIEPNVPFGFFHSHLNDLLCIPFLLPLMLVCARRLGLRRHDRPPLAHEIVIPLIIWSILFEIVYPQHAFWGYWTTSDHRDILYYSLGAFIASTFWTRYYGVETG